jgi:hypothetical protein
MAIGVCVFLLFALGKYSPIYLIYTIPPFSYFRVPARFLWIAVPSMLLISAYGLDAIKERVKSKTIVAVVFGLCFLQIALSIGYWNRYHLLQQASVWLKTPIIAQQLKPDDLILSVFTEKAHNDIFLSSGWKDEAAYLFLNNAIHPNSNAIWGISNIEGYFGRDLRRLKLASQMLSLPFVLDKTGVILPTTDLKPIQLFGVTQVLSCTPLTHQDLTLKDTIHYGDLAIYRYLVGNTVKYPYIPSRQLSVSTYESALRALQQESSIFDLALTETQKNATDTADATVSRQKLSDTHYRYSIQATNQTKMLLVDDILYYPGWKAYGTDNTPRTIQPVNIRNIGIDTREGDTSIDLIYAPEMLHRGLIITLTSFTLLLTFTGIYLLRHRR